MDGFSAHRVYYIVFTVFKMLLYNIFSNSRLSFITLINSKNKTITIPEDKTLYGLILRIFKAITGTFEFS